MYRSIDIPTPDKLRLQAVADIAGLNIYEVVTDFFDAKWDEFVREYLSTQHREKYEEVEAFIR